MTVRTWVDENAQTLWGEPCIRVGQHLAGGRWDTEMDVVIRDGREAVASLTIFVPLPRRRRLSDLKLRPLTDAECAEMKRALRQGLMRRDLDKISLRNRTAGLNMARLDPWLAEHGIDLYASLPGAPSLAAPAPKKGRGWTSDQKAGLALRYLDLKSKRNVNALIAAEYAAEGTEATPSDVANWIRNLRKERWLTAAPKQGLPGGEAGRTLKAWLKKREREGQTG